MRVSTSILLSVFVIFSLHSTLALAGSTAASSVVTKNTVRNTGAVAKNSRSETTIDSDRPTKAPFKTGATLYWQLQGPIPSTLNASVIGIDLEDNEFSGLIQQLQRKGKSVICYLSAGSYEDWRSDSRQFKPSDLGFPLGNWPGEYHLDIRSDNVRQIMRSRIDRAAMAGCDAIEPDNTDIYQYNNGFGLSEKDQIDYLLFLADYAHSQGLSIGLKNTVDLISSANLAEVFDWSLNESCYAYNECDALKPFTDRNKAVFIAMYSTKHKSDLCDSAKRNRFHLAFYNQALDGTNYSTCD